MANPPGNETPGTERPVNRSEQRREARRTQTYKTFLKELCSAGGFDEVTAEQAAASVLCALEQRIMREEAEQMEAQLPAKLRELLQRCERHEGRPPEKFGVEGFVRMVGEELSMDTQGAEGAIRAVIHVLKNHISEGEQVDVERQLPPDLREMWQSIH